MTKRVGKSRKNKNHYSIVIELCAELTGCASSTTAATAVFDGLTVSECERRVCVRVCASARARSLFAVAAGRG